MEDDLQPRLAAELPGEARRRALRGFGIGLGAVLTFFAWRSWRSSGVVPPWAGLVPLSWALAALAPAAFGPVYGPWMRVVAVLARVNLWVVCGLLYYAVITPYAAVLRAFGARPLELGLRERDSYWDEKPPRDPAESAERLF